MYLPHFVDVIVINEIVTSELGCASLAYWNKYDRSLNYCHLPMKDSEGLSETWIKPSIKEGVEVTGLGEGRCLGSSV